MKSLEEMNSAELKDTLSNLTATLSESGEVEQRQDIRQALEPEDELSGMREEAQQRQHEYEVLSPSEKLNFHGLPAPEQEDAQQKAAQFVAALNLDLTDLGERYGVDLVQKYSRDLQTGRHRMANGLEKIPHAVEYDFKEFWLPGQKVSASDLDKCLPHTDEFGNIEDSEKFIPLHSRSMDALVPERIRPAKPKPRVERPIRVPDLSSQDLQEALGDWMKKHPERFR